MDIKRLSDAKQMLKLNISIKVAIRRILQYHYLGYVPDDEILRLKCKHPKEYSEVVNEMNLAFNKSAGLED